MNKWISVAAIVVLLLCVGFGSAQAQWTYSKLFPNNTLSLNTGMNNTMTVDPTGKVWIVPYTGTIDSLQVNGVYKGTWRFYVYNADGSAATTYGPVLTYGSTKDTLYTAATGYGMTTDHLGNIVVLKGSTTIRKINYQTGAEMSMKANPLAGYTSSLACPMLDGIDEAFLTSVVPTTNVGPTALSSDFSSAAAVVDTGMYGNYSRCVSVTSSGNDVYVHPIGHGTLHYHSSNGTLGTYHFVDTLWKDLVIESSAWRPGTSQLWVSSGNVTSGMPTGRYSGYAWYGFDMTNPDSPVLKDSILWNGNTGISGDSIKNDPRPRGIAFSPNGNIAYVAAFSPSIGFIEVFNKVTAVEKTTQELPVDFALEQNFPNPFNPTTEIKFSIAKSGMTTLKVYDVLGREVASLVDQELSAGKYTVPFNALRLASGTYIYELRSGDVTLVKKMMLMK